LSELYSFFQPSTAPGREGQAPAPAAPPATTQAAEGAPPARAPSGGFGDWLMPMAMVVPMIVFMLWMQRSNSKKQQQLESSLKVGDKVILRDGIIGKIIDLGARAKVEIAPGVNITILRAGIDRVDSGDAKPAADKKVDDKKGESTSSEEKKA
jgi:preprotein translocase subunit YajC